MTEQRSSTALTALQWTLGVVILVEAILFVMPGARQDFARTHMPGVLRLILGWGEIIGAILVLIPRTVSRGSWSLMAVFVLAIAIHLLHGMYNVGNLVIYAAAAWVIANGKSAARIGS
jgi:uncharacterized membrane protein YphA (DoxX/SURF4 family)